MKLSQKVVDGLQLPAGKVEAFYWDDDVPGLGVRIQGKRLTWVVQTRIGGRTRRMTLGPVAGLSLKDARKRAGRVITDARDGVDVVAERDARRETTIFTVKMLREAYIKRRAEPHQRAKTLAQTRRYLEVAWKALENLPVASVTRAQVAQRLGEIVDQNGPIAANRARAAFSAMYAWGMGQGLVDANPCAGAGRPAPERQRDRTLTEAEIKLLWRATADDSDYDRIIRLLLLTGQRREEIAGMTWDEVDLDKAVWTLPASRSKNRRSHEIPLPRQVVEILQQIRRKEGRPFVFGRTSSGPFSGFSKSKTALDAALSELNGKPLSSWVLHDLRRTCATGMSDIGIQPHVVEACLNHLSGSKAGVAGVYNRSSYSKEKRQAFQAWADHVESVVAGLADRLCMQAEPTE